MKQLLSTNLGLGMLLLSAACGTDANLSKNAATAPQALGAVQIDMFGKNGAMAFDANEQPEQPEQPDASDPDDATTEDPNDLKDKVDCDALSNALGSDMVELNQHADWHAVVTSGEWGAFSKLSIAATNKGCDGVEKSDGDKDEGDKGDKDKGDKGDKGDKDKGDKGDKDKGDNKKTLEFGCDILVPKLQKAWSRVKALPAWSALHASIPWSHVHGNYTMWVTAECGEE